jgi:hypothetical protein
LLGQCLLHVFEFVVSDNDFDFFHWENPFRQARLIDFGQLRRAKSQK